MCDELDWKRITSSVDVNDQLYKIFFSLWTIRKVRTLFRSERGVKNSKEVLKDF